MTTEPNARTIDRVNAALCYIGIAFYAIAGIVERLAA